MGISMSPEQLCDLYLEFWLDEDLTKFIMWAYARIDLESE